MDSINQTAELNTIINLVSSVGTWVIFAWLYMQERKAHDETRTALIHTLREIAGLDRPLPPRVELTRHIDPNDP